MTEIKTNHREIVTKLGDANRKIYGSPEGRGVLNTIELTFDNYWVYLYELVQNALDAGASSIQIRIVEDDDALIFQHNGKRPFKEKDIAGLSKIFQSTKGARSVGFMGIGFKSVFNRFQEVQVSGWGWTFRYEIDQVIGEEFGDVQRDFLGSVIPIWDDRVAEPEGDFTTCFKMFRRTNKDIDLKSDLMNFFPDDDSTPLAILARHGLKNLELNDQIWKLKIDEEFDKSFKVAAFSKHGSQYWQIFSVNFQPSREAIACFLEHRKIQPSQDDRTQVYSDATRTRQVFGVLPLDNKGVPMPPARGNIYATLPTEVTLPFGLHINGDWLLNISRDGLREIEDNPWQQEIVEKIADILVFFLHWSANSYSDPDTARAAYRVLRSPSSEAGGIESLLANDRWLSILQDGLKEAAILPVWVKTTTTLDYARASDVLFPPAPLARIFANQPNLSPAVLLNGHVLMEEVLGKNAVELFCQIDLLTDMSVEVLEETWSDGLEDWWESLSDEDGSRKHLLFHLWAAIAELSSYDAWETLNVPCVRSMSGEWISVDEATFLTEILATDDEPGGQETRRLLQRFISDSNRLDPEWVMFLRRRHQESEYEIAWNWIKEHACSIDLSDIVKDTFASFSSWADPDWSVLVSYGHWAKHRNRADLLIYALAVQSNGDWSGIPIQDALLADPYVEHGQGRRRLFSDTPSIAGVYMETDPENAGAHEWRIFFEKAGAKGDIEIKRISKSVGRWEVEKIVTFLDSDVNDITESNNDGYTLWDFDIEPCLPDVDAPIELRATLASWLEDGFGTLKGKGKRKATWFYYSNQRCTGNKSSLWVTKLSQLAWVPSDDGNLRRPQDILEDHDPARVDVPFANLSSRLLSTLNQEGVKFGTKIPEVTSLHRLERVGSELNAVELAELLSECREQITTDEDQALFGEILQDLRLPTNDDQRVTLDRIVQRVAAHLRGPLGGWIVSLDHIQEPLRMELEHVDFPHKFPETTTGTQALNYIHCIWRRARISDEGLASEIRDVLPTAYTYCLDDSAQDESLFEQWKSVLPQAMVFADRKWIALADAENLYFDDSDDRRFLPKEIEIKIATSGHLGRSRNEQFRTAEKLNLSFLSTCVTREWSIGSEKLSIPGSWISRFRLICELLHNVRRGEFVEYIEHDIETEIQDKLNLTHVDKLILNVRVDMSVTKCVLVNARLDQDTLIIAGDPLQFGADAAKELLQSFSFGQRAELAADLTGMFVTIDNEKFKLAVNKFQQSYASDFKLPKNLGFDSNDEKYTNTKGKSTERRESDESNDTDKKQILNPQKQDRCSSSDNGSKDTSDATAPEKSEDDNSNSTNGSFSKADALAQQNTIARQLRNSIKGEIVPQQDIEETDVIKGDENKNMGDEEYREAAAQYERKAGRIPELGDPYQSGYDIWSIDPKTEEIRLIEVKGKGCRWDDDEVVELSRAQVRTAFEATESWYLYVVEKTDEDSYRVLPIKNPVETSAKWILCGESWRMMAEESEVITIPEK